MDSVGMKEIREIFLLFFFPLVIEINNMCQTINNCYM